MIWRMGLAAAFAATTFCLGCCPCGSRGCAPVERPTHSERPPPPAADERTRTLEVFRDNTIHFDEADSLKFETIQVSALDKGRVIYTYREFADPMRDVRITARVETRPIPKNVMEVHDRWDRAGNVRLSTEHGPDVEIVKFITAYGGVTTHEVDISHLAPFFTGPCVFKGFVDTWSSPGWEMDFELSVTPDMNQDNPTWGQPLFYEESLTRESLGENGVTATVSIPPDLQRIELHYLVSGHCTDGRGADEFEAKDNVLFVDGRELLRLRPWRDDCLRFRTINPYCRRWSDGSWSSDFSRSGWCPGDTVAPAVFDVTTDFPSGDHEVGLLIEDVRPKNDEGHYGYWRVSAYLLGWSK